MVACACEFPYSGNTHRELKTIIQDHVETNNFLEHRSKYSEITTDLCSPSNFKMK